MAGEESVVVHEDWTKDNSLINATSQVCVCVCGLAREDIPLFRRTRDLLCEITTLLLTDISVKHPMSSPAVELMYTVYTCNCLVSTVHACPHRQIQISTSIRPPPLTHPGVANLSE